MTDSYLTHTRLQQMTFDPLVSLPGDVLYNPRLDSFAVVVCWSATYTMVVRQSWAVHFYGRLMQAVAALQCGWIQWRKDCV